MSPDQFQSELALLRARLAEAQASARRLRSESFVRYTPVVAGQRLLPLTLPLYNRLVAFESPFVVGGHISLDDVHVFIWALHPQFDQFDARLRRECWRAVHRALSPRWPLRNLFCRSLAVFPRFRWLSRWCEPTAAELVAEAAAECSRLVVEAIGDFPGTSSGPVDGEPVEESLPFPLQAQVINLLRRELGLSFEESRALPMKELAQHVREVVHVASKGRALLLSREEAAVWHAYENLLDRQAASNPHKS